MHFNRLFAIYFNVFLWFNYSFVILIDTNVVLHVHINQLCKNIKQQKAKKLDFVSLDINSLQIDIVSE